MVKKYRNTRFDADSIVAERCYREWIKNEHSPWINTNQTEEFGIGSEEVYAFTFPSLQELARLKDSQHYPIKVGYTGNQDAGAVQRIRNQMLEAVAFPERPLLLLICRTWNGRALEQLIHTELRKRSRRLATAPGLEWFLSNTNEVAELCGQFNPDVRAPTPKPLSGASPSVSDLMADGAQIELIQGLDSACIGIRFSNQKQDEEQS